MGKAPRKPYGTAKRLGSATTAVRMFLSAAIAKDGMPFAVKYRKPKADLLEAIQDTRDRRNLHGPYKTAEEAVAAMLED